MDMPSLIPRDVHHLWLQKEASSRSTSRNHNNKHHPHQSHEPDEPSFAHNLPSSSATSFSSAYAPPLSSYSSERPGALLAPPLSGSGKDLNNDLIQNDIQAKLRQLKSIRTLGYSYLAPLGICKTMAALDEEAEIKRQMEEQFERAETATAENLLGEVNEAEQQQQQEAQQGQNDQNTRGSNDQQQDLQHGYVDEQESQQTEVTDLDDEIPEAAENSYSLAYDDGDDDLEPVDDVNEFESQYDRGFMVTEQYESQEFEESSQRQVQQTQFVTPTRLDQSNTSQQQIGRFVQNNLRSFSGSSSFNTIGDNSFDIANGSINESDLDMTIDE